MIDAGTRFLLTTQHSDGGWGGAPGTPPSLEETALAVDTLSGPGGDEARQARERGVAWLIQAWDEGAWREATPIGFYFANLWYFEDMYPLTFLLAALGRGGTD